jgi:multicomponent Na+:H+ antiporter subunit G
LIDVLQALLILIGVSMLLIASIGIVRLHDVQRRIHVPIKAATLGVIPLLLAEMLASLDEPTIAKVLLIILFTAATTAITAHVVLLAARRSGLPAEDEGRDPGDKEG